MSSGMIQMEPMTNNSKSKLDWTKRNRFKNQKCHACGQKVWKCFTDFSSHTSIHGIQYLGEEKRPYWERIFWILVFIVSMYLCITMIYTQYRKWDESPVFVSFDDRETDVWKIPFPAVTICPETKVNMAYFKNETFPYLVDLIAPQICKTSYSTINESYFETEEDKDMLNNFRKISADIFFTCKWKGISINCKNILNEIITEDGICYNFNGLIGEDLYKRNTAPKVKLFHKSHSKWDRHNGYITSAGLNTFPKRVLGSGKHRGLEIKIEQLTEQLDDYICKNFYGLKMLIHAPDNVPRVLKRSFRVPHNQETTISIKPNMIFTSNELRAYTIEKRQCVFDDEVNLAYFKRYTKINCEAECVTNFTLSECGCIKFYMPQIENAPICLTTEQVKCSLKAEDKLIENELNYLFNKNDRTKKFCECLPSCTNIEYNIETAQAPYSLKLFYEHYLESIDQNDTMTNNKENNTEYENTNLNNENRFVGKRNLDEDQNDSNYEENYNDYDQTDDENEDFDDSNDEDDDNENSDDSFIKPEVYRNLPVELKPNVTPTDAIKKLLEKYNDLTLNTVSSNISAVKLTIFFKEDSFLSSKRSELYGLSTFLSNCGGLLGLFMGISALSFIEIFYFSTIRIISDRYNRNRYQIASQYEN